MNLLSSKVDKDENSRHWVVLDSHRATPDQEALRQLKQKLELALDELGHIDYQLSGTLAKLQSDLTIETHDNLNGQVAQLVGPGIREAMMMLANELNKAMSLTEEVISDGVRTEKAR